MSAHKKVKLRQATIRDLHLVKFWDTQQHVIDADPDDDWNWEVELARIPTWREQLIAELDDRAIGFIQIIDPAEEESHYWGEVPKNLKAIDIWIGEKQDLGKGYGTAMMKQAIERCFEENKVTSILIDPLASNAGAIRFYERIGFQFLEKRDFGQCKCLVY
ncbi:MAG: GNAT family N-acetyltransferase [Cyclobacteriaceae bacterium]|nr:GNAT family N-acetyltransferase [Cyclobacteriaceae bacterium HetDA_MAG_MS6]